MRGKEINNNYGNIYESARNSLENQLFQIERLETEGKSLGGLNPETEARLKKLIEEVDRQKLAEKRQELKEQK